jgi:pentatricopeptide repeat protein
MYLNFNQSNRPFLPIPHLPSEFHILFLFYFSNKVEAHLVQVFLLFGEMRARGVEPDRAAYNALMEACARAGAVDKCAGVLNDLVSRSV